MVLDTMQEMERPINSGWNLARQMSWEQVVSRFLIPALQRTGDLAELEMCPT